MTGERMMRQKQKNQSEVFAPKDAPLERLLAVSVENPPWLLVQWCAQQSAEDSSDNVGETMWKEQNHAPKGQRNFGDEWGRLSITLKKAKPFAFFLAMDDHLLEYDGVRILYSSRDDGNLIKRPSIHARGEPRIPLKKLVETFKVFCKRVDPEIRDFVLARIKEPKSKS